MWRVIEQFSRHSMSETDLPPGERSRAAGPTGQLDWPTYRPSQPRAPRCLIVLFALALVAAAAIVASRAVTSNPSGIVARVDPGLVDISVTLGLQDAGGEATGMVLTATGEVLTNDHVIEGATAIRATDIGNGRTYSASVVGYDRRHDLAVLQLQGASGLRTVPLGSSSTVRVGAIVTAVGNAGGAGGTPSEALGRITGLQRSITASDPGGGNAERLHGLIETDAAVQPGDSGGPLLNSAGQAIAMDTATSVSFASRSAASQGFAIPVDAVLAVSRQIEAGVGSSSVHIGPTGFLGIQIAVSDSASGSQPSGVLLAGVLPGLPAEHAGLAQGDVITALDGQLVGSSSALLDLLVPHHPGDAVQLSWLDQSGQSHSATLRLASGPPA